MTDRRANEILQDLMRKAGMATAGGEIEKHAATQADVVMELYSVVSAMRLCLNHGTHPGQSSHALLYGPRSQLQYARGRVRSVWRR